MYLHRDVVFPCRNKPYTSLEVDCIISQLNTTIDTKQTVITRAASSITSNNSIINKTLISDGVGKATASTISNVELGAVRGIVQMSNRNLNNK